MSDLVGDMDVFQCWRNGKSLMLLDCKTGQSRTVATVSGNVEWSGRPNRNASKITFWAPGNNLYVVNWDGSNLKRIAGGQHPHFLGIDQVVYMSGGGTYKVKLNASTNEPGGSTKLSGTQCEAGIIGDGKYLAETYRTSFMIEISTGKKSPSFNNQQNCSGSAHPGNKVRMMFNRDPEEQRGLRYNRGGCRHLPARCLISHCSIGHIGQGDLYRSRDKESVEKTAHYTISNGITVTAASLDSDNTSVRLTTSVMTLKNTYTLTVSNITDRSKTPHTMQQQSMSFTYLEGIPLDDGYFTELLCLENSNNSPRLSKSAASDIEQQYAGNGKAIPFDGQTMTAGGETCRWALRTDNNGTWADGSQDSFVSFWHITVVSPSDQQVKLAYRHDDDITAWHNGVAVIRAASGPEGRISLSTADRPRGDPCCRYPVFPSQEKFYHGSALVKGERMRKPFARNNSSISGGNHTRYRSHIEGGIVCRQYVAF